MEQNIVQIRPWGQEDAYDGNLAFPIEVRVPAEGGWHLLSVREAEAVVRELQQAITACRDSASVTS